MEIYNRRTGLLIATVPDRSDLTDRDLPESNFLLANLSHATMRRSNFRRSVFRKAVMWHADATSANMHLCDFTEANCSNAIFQDTNLSLCNFNKTNLDFANLSYANLTGADLRGAMVPDIILLHADITDVIGLEEFNIIPAGDIIGWKKLREGRIAKLLIPFDAPRINAIGARICRASTAKVLEIKNAEGDGFNIGFSRFDQTFEYPVGEWVVPRYSFDDDVRDPCSSGINFFLTREEALRV